MYRIASNKRPGAYLFRSPLDPALIQAPALILFIRYFDPALLFLFTTLTGTFIFTTTENISSIKKG